MARNWRAMVSGTYAPIIFFPFFRLLGISVAPCDCCFALAPRMIPKRCRTPQAENEYFLYFFYISTFPPPNAAKIAVSEMCVYLSVIAADAWPTSSRTIGGGIPASTRRVMNVCRKAWKPVSTCLRPRSLVVLIVTLARRKIRRPVPGVGVRVPSLALRNPDFMRVLRVQGETVGNGANGAESARKMAIR